MKWGHAQHHFILTQRVFDNLKAKYFGKFAAVRENILGCIEKAKYLMEKNSEF